MTASASQAFEHLHALLQQLEDAERLLAHGPKRTAVAEKKVTAAEQDCSDQKEKIKQLRKSADQSAMNLKSREAELAKLALRLNEAGSNKEYEIIQNQITAAKKEDAKLEDEVLALLDQVDQATEELQMLEQQLEELKQKAAQIADDVRAKEPGLKSDVERLTGEIAEAESIIPGGDPKTTYKRLRAAQGASAMSRVEDGYCTECNTGATPQDTVRLNLGEFVLCRACGRLLYRTESE